jgi:hypothetical protein
MLDTTICCGGYGCNDLQDLWREPSQNLRKILHSEGVFRDVEEYCRQTSSKSVPAQERNGEYQDEDEPSHNILLASAIVASAVANRSTARTGLAQQLKSLMRSWVHRRIWDWCSARYHWVVECGCSSIRSGGNRLFSPSGRNSLRHFLTGFANLSTSNSRNNLD